MKKDLWKNFELKVVALVLFIVVSVSISSYAIIYNRYYDFTINNLKDEARTVHNYTEEFISPDSFSELNNAEDEADPIYQTARRQLDEIRRIANIRYLYTAKQNSGGDYIYVLDGLDPAAEDFRHVGDPIEPEIIPPLMQCLNNEVVLDDRILVTDWGVVYVAYFPVHGSGGNVIGAIGMEFDCESLYNSFNRIITLTLIATFLIAVIFTVIAIAVLKKVINHTENILAKKDALLVAAKEEAQASSNAKSEFMGRVSHEIITPMNAIIGMTAIADRTKDMEKIKHCLGTIGGSSAQLLNLFNDILDISRIDSGKFELSMKPFDMEKMLAKIRAAETASAKRKNQRFKMITDAGLSRMYIGDEARIAQVITNLLSNAFKFTPENGDVALTVTETESGGEYSCLRFQVTDTGIGMTGEQLQTLFDPFEQADGGMARKYGGVGLGLAISKSIVEKLGGELRAESEAGKGSAFTFDVKLYKLTETGGQAAPPDFTGVRILLADDVNINIEIIKALLEGTNIEIDTAVNGLEAVRLFGANPDRYSLIFMDVQMPEMDGCEAARVIRGLDVPNGRTVPIIAVTANISKEDIEKCFASGMDGHLPKPIDPVAIIGTITKHAK